MGHQRKFGSYGKNQIFFARVKKMTNISYVVYVNQQISLLCSFSFVMEHKKGNQLMFNVRNIDQNEDRLHLQMIFLLQDGNEEYIEYDIYDM